jgi:phage tail-like protein
MKVRRFHFETPAQWRTCLFVQADSDATRAHGSVQPFPAYSRTAARVASQGAFAPAVTPSGDLIWRDQNGCLLRLTACDGQPLRSAAAEAIGKAHRLLANLSGLWAISPTGDQLQRYDDETLSRILTIDLPGMTAVDIVDAGRGQVLVLVRRDDARQVLRIDSAGHTLSTIELRGCPDATGFAYLRRTKRLVVLGGKIERRLYWFALNASSVGADFSRSTAALHPCFAAHVLGSDGRDRLFVAGQDGAAFGGAYVVVVLDADGNILGDVPIEPVDAPPTGVAGSRGSLFVTGSRGLLRFDAADVVPEGAGELRARLLTPMLSAPDREDRRRWLRIDATADLPEGSTLEIAVAHTAERETRDRLLRLANDSRANASERITMLLDETEVWRQATVLHGRATAAGIEPDPLSAPLFDITDPYVWVLVTLRAAPGARLPKLSTLDVLYPGRTLMEYLPSIYQREEERPDSFLRPLVGVLEATTQGLDARIQAMSDRLLPERAPAPWLDFVAKWLGVPWDEAMTEAQKRRVLANAPALARGRGTRVGLETLLESLLPGEPGTGRRYRVIDATADFGFARVGGTLCAGSALPALLGGRTRWNSELGRDSIVGRMRLPCRPGETQDTTRHLASQILVEIAAKAEERRVMGLWLEAVLRDMVPLNVRLRLRWVPAQALRGNRLGENLRLDGAPAAELGSGAITGLARLPQRGGRLSRTGPTLSTPLR